MRYFKIAIFVFVGICFSGVSLWATPGAYAPYSSSATCTNGTYTANTPMWGATCNGVAVKGVGICSNVSGSAGSSTNGILGKDGGTGGDIANNMHCWCKIVKPATSHWVWVSAAIGSTGFTTCLENCGNYCQMYIRSNSAIRTKLLTTFQDETTFVYPMP